MQIHIADQLKLSIQMVVNVLDALNGFNLVDALCVGLHFVDIGELIHRFHAGGTFRNRAGIRIGIIRGARSVTGSQTQQNRDQ